MLSLVVKNVGLSHIFKQLNINVGPPIANKCCQGHKAGSLHVAQGRQKKRVVVAPTKLPSDRQTALPNIVNVIF